MNVMAGNSTSKWHLITDDQDLDQQLASSCPTSPTLLHFVAEGCAYCHTMTPAMKQLATKYPMGEVFKIDVYSCMQAAAQHSIQVTPIWMLMRAAKTVTKSDGVQPDESAFVEAAVERSLGAVYIRFQFRFGLS